MRDFVQCYYMGADPFCSSVFSGNATNCHCINIMITGLRISISQSDCSSISTLEGVNRRSIYRLTKGSDVKSLICKYSRLRFLAWSRWAEHLRRLRLQVPASEPIYCS